MQVDLNSFNAEMGFASVNNNGGWHNCNSDGNFAFRKRLERIDWRKIAAIDVDRISRELDFDSLQENIANVAFCNIECELDSRFIDPNYVKLFKLAQLIVEYLLHSQDYLSHTVVALEEKCKYLTCEIDKEKSSKEATESAIKALKDDIKKYKKIICSQQTQPVPILPTECHSCPFCPKIFLTPDYLQLHVNRRHVKACVSSETQNQVSQVVDKLERELNQMKERLRTTECQLQEEKKLKQSEQVTLDFQKWKREQLECQKKDIESIRDLFMKEMRELNDRTLYNEHCVNNLQREIQDVCVSPTQSPAVAYQTTNEESSDLLKGQKKEFTKLKKHLAQHVEDVVCRHLKDREDLLETKIKGIVKDQNQELEKLNCLMRDKFKKPDADLVQTDCLLQDLCVRTKEQEKQLKKQHRKIQELLSKPQVIPICQDELPKEKCKETPEICTKPKKNSDSNSVDTLNLSPRSARMNEARKRNRSLVQSLRNELSVMMHEKLENLGIGVSTKSSIEDEVLNDFVKKIESGKIDAIKKLQQAKGENCKDDKHPRSNSWPSDLTEDDEYEDSDEQMKPEIISHKPKEGVALTRSPSLPTTLSQQSEGEWQRKTSKQSRFTSTKQSLTKLVSSVKKKFKPHKFWHAVPQSTPVVPESKIEENLKVIRQESEPVLAAALNESEYVTESEGSDDEVAESEDEEEEEDEHEEDEGEREETKPSEQKQVPQTPKKIAIKTESTNTASSSDWESPNETVEEKTPVQTSARLFTVLPQKSSKAPMSQLVQKIESKLTSQRQKPFGGVDTIDIKQKQKSPMEPSSDFDDSSDEEEDVTKNKKPDSRGSDLKGKPTRSEQTTVHKMSSWPSDDDVSEIT